MTGSVDPRRLTRGTISGRVCAADGAPLANAKVAAVPHRDDRLAVLVRGLYCVESDATGHYVIADVLPGEYRLALSARDHHAPKREVAVAPGVRAVADLTAQPGGDEIRGVVTDFTGAAIAGASVYTHDGITTATDADGHYALWVDCVVHLEIRAAGFASAMRCYGRGSTKVVLIPEVSIHGCVVDERGAPVAAALVYACDEDVMAAPRPTTVTESDGTFALSGLEPGAYQVVAYAEHHVGVSHRIERLGVGRHARDLRVVMRSAPTISGTVLVGGEPRADATLIIGDGLGDVPLRREGPSTFVAYGVFGDRLRTIARYVGFNGCLGGAMDHLSMTDRDVTGHVWKVGRDAEISGRLLGPTGRPLARARLALCLRDGGQICSQRTAADGAYVLTGLQPGTYEPRVELESGDNVLGGSTLPVGRAFKIKKRDVLTRDFTVAEDPVLPEPMALEGKAWIRGCVLDSAGSRVGGALVVASPGVAFETCVRTDHSGAFEIRGLEKGSYHEVTAYGPRGERSVPIDACTGDSVDIVVSLTASIRGTVRTQERFITVYLKRPEQTGHEPKFMLRGPNAPFELHGLEAGSYVIAAHAADGCAEVTLELAAGEVRDDVDLHVRR